MVNGDCFDSDIRKLETGNRKTESANLDLDSDFFRSAFEIPNFKFETGNWKRETS
jgi:hypothetical protein